MSSVSINNNQRLKPNLFDAGVFLYLVGVVVDDLGLCRHVPLKHELDVEGNS